MGDRQGVQTLAGLTSQAAGNSGEGMLSIPKKHFSALSGRSHGGVGTVHTHRGATRSQVGQSRTDCRDSVWGLTVTRDDATDRPTAQGFDWDKILRPHVMPEGARSGGVGLTRGRYAQKGNNICHER